MTPRQTRRLAIVKSAAEKLKLAKKEGKLKAKLEAKVLYQKLLTQYEKEALSEYYVSLSVSVDEDTSKFLAGMEWDDEDEVADVVDDEQPLYPDLLDSMKHFDAIINERGITDMQLLRAMGSEEPTKWTQYQWDMAKMVKVL